MKWLFLLCQFDAFSLQSSLMCYWESLFFFFFFFFHSDAELKIKETEQIQQQTGKGCSTDAVCRTITQCWNPGTLTRTYPSFSMLCRLFPSRNSQHHPLRPPPALLNVVWAVTDKGHRPSEATQTFWCHTDHLTPHRSSEATQTI